MIVWIASYPKSGNTWLRYLLADYLYGNQNSNFDYIENEKFITQFPNFQFFKFLKKDRIINSYSKLKDINFTSQFWIEAQRKINEKHSIIFLKTHFAVCSINNNFFTNKANTAGAIYIVRDPRQVLLSLNKFYKFQSIDKSLKFLLNNQILDVSINNKNYPGIPISDWGTHVTTWYELRKQLPIFFIKYEDMIKDIKKVFFNLLDFLKRNFNIEPNIIRARKSLERINFETLKKNERLRPHVLFSHDEGNYLFNEGKVDTWKSILTNYEIKKIENKYTYLLKVFNYI